MKIEKRDIYLFLSLLSGFVLFFFILTAQIPGIFRQAAIQFKYAYTIPFFLLGVIIALLYFTKLKISHYLYWPVLCAVFSLPLAGMWTSGITEAQTIGGLLPTVDAGMYYVDSLRLLNGISFSSFSSRRPIFATYFSTITHFSGLNLQISLAIMLLFNIIAIFIASESVRKNFGKFPVIIFILANFFFIRKFTGRVMTENLGFMLGLISLVILASGSYKKSGFFTAWGIFLLTVALNVRAGPFLILPLFVLWSWIKENNRKDRLQSAGIAAFAIIAGFLFNAIIYKIFGTPEGIPFANFIESLYGMVRGGIGWGAIYTENPHLIGLNDQLMVKEGIPLILSSFISNPILFFEASMQELGQFFNTSSLNSLFSFVYFDNRQVFLIVQITLQIFFYTGLISAWRKRSEDPINQVFLVIFIGSVFSVPFAPVSDAEGMRAFATIIPFTTLVAGIGFQVIVKFLFRLLDSAPEYSHSTQKIGFAFSILILLATTIIPYILKTTAKTQDFHPIQCAENEILINTNIYPGSYLLIYPEETFFLDWLPKLHFQRFKERLRIYPPYFVKFFTPDSPPYQISLNLDYSSQLINNESYVLVKDQNYFNKPGKYSFCGYYLDSKLSERFGKMFIVNSIHQQESFSNTMIANKPQN